MVILKVLAHKLIVAGICLGFGATTLFAAHEAAGAAVYVGSLVVSR